MDDEWEWGGMYVKEHTMKSAYIEIVDVNFGYILKVVESKKLILLSNMWLENSL